MLYYKNLCLIWYSCSLGNELLNGGIELKIWQFISVQTEEMLIELTVGASAADSHGQILDFTTGRA
jgi:hypothetical protein